MNHKQNQFIKNMARGRKLAWIIITICSPLLLMASQAVLIKAASPEAHPPNTFWDAKDFVNVGDKIFFTAEDSTNRRELWITNPSLSAPMLVKDIRPGGISDSEIQEMVTYRGQLYFTAYDGSTGMELWKSDGTTAGTNIVKDIAPAERASNPIHLTLWKGYLYFFAADAAEKYSLWRTDGTEQGTERIVEATPNRNTHLKSVATTDACIFFTCFNELWTTDGTAQGTRLVVRMASNRPEAGITEVAALDNFVLFVVKSRYGRELWRSDGTAKGTFLLKDIRKGPKDSDPKYLTRYGDKIIFSADNGIHGTEVWLSDGTLEGTQLLIDLQPGPASSDPWNFLAKDDQLYFITKQITRDQSDTTKQIWESSGTPSGRTIWKSNATSSGTFPLQNYGVYHEYSGLYGFWITAKGLFFIAPSNNGRNALYFSNTKGEVTACKHGLNIDQECRFSAGEVNGNLVYYYRGLEREHGLGFSDGTGPGTQTIKLSQPLTRRSWLINLLSFRQEIVFAQQYIEKGQHFSVPWISDGTSEGTKPLPDTPRPGYPLATVGDRLYLRIQSPNYKEYEIWQSDGTAEGTHILPLATSMESLKGPGINIGPWIFFSGYDKAHGQELWRADQDGAHFEMLKDIFPGSNDGIQEPLMLWQGRLFFLASDPEAPLALWTSDGTQKGTVKISAITLGAVNPLFDHVRSTNRHAFLFCARNRKDTGGELWRSDGTDKGTYAVRDNQGNRITMPGDIWTENDGISYFSAFEADHSVEVWRSDGTSKGTHRINDIRKDISNRTPRFLDLCGGTLYYAEHDGVHGWELWKTDGTEAGTVMIKDIWPGSSGSLASAFQEAAICDGQALLFSASDGLAGCELWRSDGTAEGTHMVQDIAPGPGSSNPNQFTLAGNVIYFMANDGLHGNSIWAIPLTK